MAILGKIDISISFKSSRILKGSSIYIISDVFHWLIVKMMALLMIHLHLLQYHTQDLINVWFQDL